MNQLQHMSIRTKLFILAMIISTVFSIAMIFITLMQPFSRASQTVSNTSYKAIAWNDLVPKEWNQNKQFKSPMTGALSDADPRSRQLMKEMQAANDNAPTVKELNGANVKISGYLVPLDPGFSSLGEFLLVPYFGACIHTPPPPANQIIHVLLSRPSANLQTMQVVTVSGTLTTDAYFTQAGPAFHLKPGRHFTNGRAGGGVVHDRVDCE